jgi:hypothetical protein
VSFAAITLCVASQRVFIVVIVYFVIDAVRKLLDVNVYTLGLPLLSTVTNQNYIHEDLKSRLDTANFCYCSVQNLLSSRLL